MHLLSEETKQRFHRLCAENGFTKRGAAQFRIRGDGVLQVLKFEYERCFSHYDLSIGLHSMYSPLLPQWFTSSGCIPRYSVCNLIGERGAVTSRTVDGFFQTFIRDPEQQLDILHERGFDFLDGIGTQEELVNALIYLETNWGREAGVLWNDGQKIAPYLKSGNLPGAERVISAILYQHAMGDRFRPLPWQEDDYGQYRVVFPGKDLELLEIHDWIRDQNTDAIEDYLNINFKNNHRLARFIK